MPVLQMEAVIRRIRRLTTADQGNKVLVFSTWQDVLEVIAHALRTNRLPFAYARGRQSMQAAIRQFKAANASGSKGGPEAVQVLLLLVKQGGQGLNLTGDCFPAPAVSTIHLLDVPKKHDLACPLRTTWHNSLIDADI